MSIIYPLSSSSWDEKEIAAMHRVIRSGRFSMGEEVSLFEKEFAEFFGSKYAVMVNSGSSANLLMIAALVYSGKLKRGDEIIVPAVSWATTYSPLQQFGLKVKFVDTDIETLNFNLEDLKNAINCKTKVIFCVNLLGNPNDFNEIKHIIGERDILLLEDNCESMGAVYKGRFTGTIGLMGSFSFFYSHHISTMEGGMITTNDDEMYHYLLSLRSHGWTRHLPKYNHLSNKSDDEFFESYRFVLPGYNVRPLELSGAIGREQIKKLPKILSVRRDNAKNFKKLVHKYNVITQNEIDKSSWFGFSMIFEDRGKAIEAFKKYGIEYRPIVAGNFTRNPVIKYFKTKLDIYPGASIIDMGGVYIGNHAYKIDFEPLKNALDEIYSLF